MNAALYRTILDLAYNKALELAVESDVRKNDEAFKEWKRLCIDISAECISEFGERPALF